MTALYAHLVGLTEDWRFIDLHITRTGKKNERFDLNKTFFLFLFLINPHRIETTLHEMQHSLCSTTLI